MELVAVKEGVSQALHSGEPGGLLNRMQSMLFMPFELMLSSLWMLQLGLCSSAHEADLHHCRRITKKVAHMLVTQSLHNERNCVF